MAELEDKEYATRWLLTKTVFQKRNSPVEDDMSEELRKLTGANDKHERGEHFEWVDDVIDLDFVKKCNRCDDKWVDGEQHKDSCTTFWFKDGDMCVSLIPFETAHDLLEKREKFSFDLRVGN